MAKDIKSILAKKTWTGDEVGKAIILSLIHSYQDTLAGKPETTLFSATKLKAMVGSLKTKEQIARYNRYVGLNNWISINQPIAMNHQQRAGSEVRRLLSLVSTQVAVEDALRAFSRLPEIMTQRQYDARVRARLRDGEGFDVLALIALATAYYLDKLESEPRKANPLKAVKKLYQRAAATDHPDGGTKWAAIEAGDLFARYDAVKNRTEAARAFVAEYPALADAMRVAVGQEGLDAGAWAATITPYRTLYDEDRFGYRDTLARDATDAAGGIAILRPGSPGIDPRTGYYTYPDAAEDPLAALGVGQLTQANPGHSQSIDEVVGAREAIADAYYYVLGFDEAVRMVAEAIEIPDFTIFALHAPALAAHIETLNGALTMLPAYIAETPQRDETARAQKLAACRDYLQPIDLTRLVIPEDAKTAARAMLDDNLRAFETQDGVFTRTLCIRSEEG